MDSITMLSQLIPLHHIRTLATRVESLVLKMAVSFQGTRQLPPPPVYPQSIYQRGWLWLHDGIAIPRFVTLVAFIITALISIHYSYLIWRSVEEQTKDKCKKCTATYKGFELTH